jgi:hypothetical protein
MQPSSTPRSLCKCRKGCACADAAQRARTAFARTQHRVAPGCDQYGPQFFRNSDAAQPPPPEEASPAEDELRGAVAGLPTARGAAGGTAATEGPRPSAAAVIASGEATVVAQEAIAGAGAPPSPGRPFGCAKIAVGRHWSCFRTCPGGQGAPQTLSLYPCTRANRIGSGRCNGNRAFTRSVKALAAAFVANVHSPLTAPS